MRRRDSKDMTGGDIRAWVARDNDGTLCLYTDTAPDRYGDMWNLSMSAAGFVVELNREMFPDVTWESEPVEVDILLITKKNGGESI